MLNSHSVAELAQAAEPRPALPTSPSATERRAARFLRPPALNSTGEVQDFRQRFGLTALMLPQTSMPLGQLKTSNQLLYGLTRNS